MASLELDPFSGRYRVRFRHDGREYKRSLRTQNHRVAAATLGQVEETLRMLEMGMTELPPEVDQGKFIVSGARIRKEKKQASAIQTLQDLFRVYEQDLPPGSKEERTLDGERLLFKHLLRHLGKKTRISAIKAASVQQYVDLRSKDKYHGRFISPDTIRKEITTLRLVWNWAKRLEHLDTAPPVNHVVYPKRDEKPPFMTMAEINRILKRGVSKEREAKLWESLYLTRKEVDSLLSHTSKRQSEPFVHPMFVLAAHTGMRRSELLRSEKSDFDFEGRTISVREKKRSRKHALSYRRVPMTALIGKVFKQFFAETPGSKYALCRDTEQQQLSSVTADYHWKVMLEESPWQNVRGFHVFRHSFASNAMAEGIDQRMIDSWMGHQTEEMRQRYRHLTPDHQQAAIDTMFDSESSPP